MDYFFQKVFHKINSEYHIGYDPLLFSKGDIDRITDKYIKSNRYIIMVPIDDNLIDKIWNRNKNFKTKKPFFIDEKCSTGDQNKKIITLLSKFSTDYLFITSPQSICWLLNIRGNDLIYTPLIMAYCLINQKGHLEIFSKLQNFVNNCHNLSFYSFEQIKDRILSINNQNKSIQFDYSKTPIWFYHNLNKKNIVNNDDPCLLLKSIKNKSEITGFKYSMIQDGIALTKLIFWLQKNIRDNIKVTETSIDKKLSFFKKKNSLFKTKSFETISAYAQNSALIHYNPYCGNNLNITTNSFYLLDCGSQYTCGTTDITRTFYFGTPTNAQRLHYTLVLKGLINLSSLFFPKKTSGSQVDVLARQFLWNQLLDYPHSTGHGVGHYSSVHEGPQGISKFNYQELCANMIITIEPGYYIPGKYGIRLENMVIIKEVEKNKNFLQFQTLTLAPIEYNLIDTNLLTLQEKKWLLLYHEKILLKLSSFLTKYEVTYLNNYINFYKNLL